jgi:C4-dicarboxylate-specific signal transduction histidine kinase
MRRRTIWTFALFIGVYIVSTFSLEAGAVFSMRMRQTILRRQEAVIKVAQINGAMSEAESSARAFLMSGNAKDLQGLESAKQTWRDQVSALTSRLVDKQPYPVDKLAPLLEQQLQDLTRIIDLKKELKKTDSSKASTEINAEVNAEMSKHSELPAISQSRALLSTITEGEVSFVQRMERSMDDRMKFRLPLLPSTNILALFLLGIALTSLRNELKHRSEAQKTIERQQKSIMYAAKMAALGEMAGGIAHEINNPLAIIAGQAQLCQDLMEAGKATDEQLMKSLGSIRHWVAHTAKIIFGLRQFARDGTQDPFQITSVNGIFEKTLDLCRETFARNGVRLETEILSDDIQIECRSVQISQVLLNLLQNALHAAEGTQDRWVKLTVGSTPKEIIFRVLDSGAGVPAEIREKVMQPFFTTKETAKGTGLGLSISKGLVESHRGEIFLDTEAANTCFVVKLPRYAKEKSVGKRDTAAHVDGNRRVKEPESIDV